MAQEVFDETAFREDEVFVAVDIANAFGEASREVALQHLMEAEPALVAHFRGVWAAEEEVYVKTSDNHGRTQCRGLVRACGRSAPWRRRTAASGP
eukprot:4764759-Alexandrium_andersonii.AAC.1